MKNSCFLPKQYPLSSGPEEVGGVHRPLQFLGKGWYDRYKLQKRSAFPVNIVLLESLGVSDETLNACAKPLVEAGHTFAAYPKDTDPAVMIQRAKDADIVMLANMPLPGEVIAACDKLKFIDVAFTGVDHVDQMCIRDRNQTDERGSAY